ncbi:MAG: hypothetical protein AB1571_03775 [Nanoarchaeota archaeon]
MRKEQLEQIERWANFIKSGNEWKKIHTKFIDSQFEKHKLFIKRLLKQDGGKEKIIKLYNIKNLKII